MRVLRLLPLLALTLTACSSDDRSSFEASGQQSLTVLVQQQWPWSKIELNVVVRSEPLCQRHYFLKNIDKKQETGEVYLYEASRYVLLMAGEKYMFDLSNCDLTHYRDVPDLKAEDTQGRFAWTKDGVFEFTPKK